MGLEPLHGGAQVSTCIAGPTLAAQMLAVEELNAGEVERSRQCT
jgi:hypothetical protein